MARLTFYRMIGLDDKVRPLNKKLDKRCSMISPI